MLNLADRTWQKFKIEQLFTVSTGANVPKSKIREGTMPRITATDTCNGIDSFTVELCINAFRTNKNCISVSFLGSVFYQPYNASYDMKIHSLTLNDRTLTRYVGLFISTELRRQFQKFSYGNQLSSSDLPHQNILLPVTTDGVPDWDFMEAYMQQKEQQLLKPTIEKLCKRLISERLTNVNGGGNSLHSNWKEFVFGEEFSIKATQSGIDKNKLINIQGDYPYITRTDTTNGMDMFVGSQSDRYCMDNGNVITIGLDTQTVFYQPTSFYTGQNIQIIRHDKLDKYNALFLIVAIKNWS